MKNFNALLPLDESANAARTVKNLICLKDKIDFPLTLLHVFDVERIQYRGITGINWAMAHEQARKAAAVFLEQQKEIFLSEGIHVDILMKEGSPRRTICTLANSGEYDLLIIGRHTEGEIKNLLFGSVSNYVIHNCKCPLFII
jgi:nucleotide-binding universal stress UspA family protein